MSQLKSHEIMALRFLMKGPDRIRAIEDDDTFAAAIVYADLAKRGLVVCDKDDGMLVTITPKGSAAVASAGTAEPTAKHIPAERAS